MKIVLHTVYSCYGKYLKSRKSRKKVEKRRTVHKNVYNTVINTEHHSLHCLTIIQKPEMQEIEIRRN